MALEDIISALEKVIHGRFKELGENILAKEDVRETLTTFFAEQQVRPYLTSLIESQTLMYEYLSLSLNEREKMEILRQTYPAYLEGEGKGPHGIEFGFHIKTQNLKDIIDCVRDTAKILKYFHFYLEEKKIDEGRKQKLMRGQIFGFGFFMSKRFKEKYSWQGFNLRSKKSHFERLLKFASEIEPNIDNYTDRSNLFLIDGPLCISEMFDFFLKNRGEFELFTSNYILNNESLKKEFGSLGERILTKARRYLKGRGSFKKLIDTTAIKHPEIIQYTQFKTIMEIDGSKLLLKIFDFYLENEKNIPFNLSYIIENKKLINKYDRLGTKLYKNARNNFKEEGGINYIVQLAAKERPEILDHWRYQKRDKKTDNWRSDKRFKTKEEFIQSMAQKFLTIFDFYLKNREEKDIFNVNYLITNKKLRKEHCHLGNSLYQKARYHLFEEGGIKYLVQLAAQQQPEILEHWRFQEKRKV